MRLLFIILTTLIIFTGCSVVDKQYRLHNKQAKQALYKQKQARIKAQRKARKEARILARKKQKEKKASITLPVRPKVHRKLKKVEDNNYSSDYMYPQGKKSSSSELTQSSSTYISPISKKECISIIGQEKFDKYTKMLGSEKASLKRCKMIKEM